MNSTSYTARSTLDYNQPSGSATTASYTLNVGWFQVNIVNTSISLTITYPINGTNVFKQCSFIVNSTATFGTGSTNRSVTFNLYKDGFFFDTKTFNLTTSGPVNTVFYGLTEIGNYNISGNISDSSGWATTDVWEAFNQMITCANPTIGVTISNTTKNQTIDYVPLNIPNFDIKTIFFLMLVGLAIYGMVHYATLIKEWDKMKIR